MKFTFHGLLGPHGLPIRELVFPLRVVNDRIPVLFLCIVGKYHNWNHILFSLNADDSMLVV